KNYDAPRNIVKLPTGLRPISEKAFEQSNGCGDDNRGVPVLTGETRPHFLSRNRIRGFRTDTHGAVMFEHPVLSKDPSIDPRRLLRDTGVGDRDDNSVKAML